MNAPDRQTLRKTLAWCGRWLLNGFGQQHRDHITIRITNKDGTEAVEVRQGPTFAERTPLLVEQAMEQGLVDLLVASFLSEDERRIITALAGGPRAGKILIDRAKIERTRFYIVAANMVDRGILQNQEDGYAIADQRTLSIIRIAAEKAEEAADQVEEGDQS